MPSSDDHKNRVKELFQEALELDETSRPGFLADACAGDETLRAEVQDLLGALAQASGFLSEPTALAEERPGARIDRYRLIDRLGEGGFGVVFRAEQIEPLQRDVALKILKRGMDSARVVRRFEHERQALARMQHPHIAAVFDAGTTPSGRPYFVMELVAGAPITRYCRERGLGIEERVALLRTVALAVQHAHHKGVVHRDLKPANILVADGPDGVPLPKVIDFGIAKALDADGDGGDTFTATAIGQPLGTLEYMAPEQTDGSDADARADVYGLGVLLYELLAGRRPFERRDTETGSTSDMLLRIRRENVLRPSLRMAAADGEPPLAGADPRVWSRRLRGDLDQVVDRALQKNPADRYPTPNALAEDLERFLAGVPVQAGSPGAALRLRRFVARHRYAAIGMCLLLLSLFAGVVSTSVALAEARTEARRQARTLGAMRDLLGSMDPWHLKGADYSARALIDDFARGIDTACGGDDVVARDLHATVGTAYRNLGELVKSKHHLGRALALSESTGDTDLLARVQLDWSWLMRELGDYAEAERFADLVLRRVEARGGGFELRLSALTHKADICRVRGEVDECERLARRALEFYEAAGEGDVRRANIATVHDLLGSVASARGHYEQALQHYRDGRDVRRRLQDPRDPTLVVSLTNVADAHRALGQADEAEANAEEALALQREMLGAEHYEVARTLTLLGDVARMRKQLDFAERHYRDALRIRAANLPSPHLELASSHGDLAMVAMAGGDVQTAIGELELAIAIDQQLGNQDLRGHASRRHNLGVCYARLERHAEAEPHYRRAVELHLQTGGPAKPATGDCLQSLALTRLALGDPVEALALHEQALAMRAEHHPDDVLRQIYSCNGIAAAARAAGDLHRVGTIEVLRADLLMRRPEQDPDEVAFVRSKAARALLEAGDGAAATAQAELALAHCSAALAGQWLHGEVAELLAQCRLACDRAAEAEPLARTAVRILRDAGAPQIKIERAEATLQRVLAARTGDAATGRDKDDRR